jgi:hypothetical protein
MSLTITKQIARKLYPESPDWFKKQLVDEFGEENLKQEDFENIKTFEDACKALSIKPNSVFNSNDLPDEVAYKKLKVIIKAINQGWIPEWNNSKQQKWFPWFNMSSGFGFSDSCYYGTIARTSVGSRLCFETKEKSDFAAEQFFNLYKEFLTIIK